MPLPGFGEAYLKFTCEMLLLAAASYFLVSRCVKSMEGPPEGAPCHLAHYAPIPSNLLYLVKSMIGSSWLNNEFRQQQNLYR